MSSPYDPHKVEQDAQQLWDERGCFKATEAE